jgi:hypothetical protein
VFCPNCMSPYVEVVSKDAEDADGDERTGAGDEPLVRCTECEYTAPQTEFVPENYR